jgi:UDP-N-acetylglucosamine 1-carboxyvinyltransferase
VEKLLINGGKPLVGQVAVSGAKNATVALIPAALLANDKCALENLPLIRDVQVLMEIIEQMGAKVRKDGTGTLEIDSSGLNHPHITNGKVKELRASYYLLGGASCPFQGSLHGVSRRL